MAALPSNLRDELRRAIEKRQLSAHAEHIEAFAAECYAMIADDEDDYSAVGNSRFGGDPDLPPTVPWPCFKTTSVMDSGARFSNFIAQINFAQLPPLQYGTVLPSTGLLYVFVRHMGSAAEPVLLDSIYFNGDVSKLTRTSPPIDAEPANEYLVDLAPVKVHGIPAVSLANFKKAFRTPIDVDDKDCWRRIELIGDLARPDQIGQLLGFANAGDERENLYRQVYLGQAGKRLLVYNDYWDTMEEFDAYLNDYRQQVDLAEAARYETMREGVKWLTSNRDEISRGTDELQLLLQIDSNEPMNLSINDYDPLYVFARRDALTRGDFSGLAGEVTQG